MVSTNALASPLANLLDMESYREQRSHVFQSSQSLHWFLRNHRDDLIDAGALIYIAGRKKIEPSRFDECVLAIGKRTAEGYRKIAA